MSDLDALESDIKAKSNPSDRHLRLGVLLDEQKIPA